MHGRVYYEDHNYCRNPLNEQKPWCYISEFEYEGTDFKTIINFTIVLPKSRCFFGVKRMIFEKTDQNATYRYALNVPVQNLAWESVVIQEKRIFDVNVFVKMEQFCMLESAFLKIQIKFKIRMNASRRMTAEPELAVIKLVINIFRKNIQLRAGIMGQSSSDWLKMTSPHT